MGLGGQAASGSSQNFQEGRSTGESASKSTFGTDSISSSSGRSIGESSGASQSTGFGFSGLNPTDSAAVSSSLTNQINNQVFPALTSASTATYDLPALTARGLYPAQEEAARKAVADSLSQISGRFASRGYLQPENVSNVAGSAVQNVLPQLMPVISQNIQTAAKAPLDVVTARAGSVAQLLQSFPGLLGSQNQQQATSQQQARSESEQIAEALQRTFGESVSRSLQEAFSKGFGSSNQSSFGFGLGL